MARLKARNLKDSSGRVGASAVADCRIQDPVLILLGLPHPPTMP